jgi:hypothetical protein
METNSRRRNEIVITRKITISERNTQTKEREKNERN